MTTFRTQSLVRAIGCSVVFLCGSIGTAQTGPANLDLEKGEIGQAPAGWFVPKPCLDAGYAVKLTADAPKAAKRSVLLTRERESDNQSFGNVMQSFEAGTYRGHRIRFRAAVRAEVAGSPNQAQLWIRVDRKGGKTGFFDNMHDRPIVSKDWREYEIAGDVDADAETISVGLLLLGGGKVWLGPSSFEIVGKSGEGNDPPRLLGAQGLANLVAFTKLLGVVRFFHPSDEAAATDWDQFAIAGVAACENARTPAELAQKLEQLFRPIAPTVRVYLSDHPPEPATATKKEASLGVTAWRHTGVKLGSGAGVSVYSSVRAKDKQPALNERLPDPEKPYVADLGAGVTCSVPLALYQDANGTLPHADAGTRKPSSSKPAGFRPNGGDRATRLADIALAWSVFQHFYPYFNVVKTDWPEVLRQSLATAATDQDGDAFLKTLRRLVAALHDGHGHVFHDGSPSSMPPFLWDWIEDRLVITQLAEQGTEGLKVGDVVVKVDSRPAAEALREQEALVSGATSQWQRYRALRELAVGEPGSEIKLEIQSGAGQPRTVAVRRALSIGALTERRPAKVTELKPGIVYVDLDRVTDQDLKAAITQLQNARGIIFDMRGYPRSSPMYIGHLIDKQITCAQWHIPVNYYPDRARTSFSFSNWKVEPRRPRFKARVAFVTDGRAISYAETYLGMIEHYRLAEIVGGPTAGTNGNVNQFVLPGGYRVVWTGMKVLKHDGSPHHGVGIRPTVPVTRTIHGVTEARDEFLERALEVVSR
jgi:C-terminal processing protease CtpA/Prc